MTQQTTAGKQIARLVSSGLPKLLVLTHAMGGGVARHLAELASALQGGVQVIQASPAGNMLRLALPGMFKGEDEVHLAFQWPDQQELFWRFLAQLGITQVHVHHVLNWPAGFWPAFMQESSEFDLTLHDHLLFSAIEGDRAIGAEDRQWLTQVQRCFGGDARHASVELYQLAVAARRVLVPSQSMHEHVGRFFPELAMGTLLYRPHPEAELLREGYPEPFVRTLSSEQPMRVLCLGMLSAEKGAQVLARVAREAGRQNLQLEFHLLGSCHVHLPSCIVRHGSYDDRQVPGLLEQINPHVLWLPAQSPETWSYTLSAGLKAGLPVVATDIGVFPERLHRRPLSWLCDAGLSTAQWLGVLMAVRKRHLQVSKAPVVRCCTPVSAFYTAQTGGYLLASSQRLYAGREPLNERQINQALVSGLPEARRWRDHTLHLLLKLKYNAWLAPLVRIIPYAWQRKVKRLISRSPLSEPPAQ